MKVEHKIKKEMEDPKNEINLEPPKIPIQFNSKDMFWSGKLNALAPRLVNLLKTFFYFFFKIL
jgi:hypothetical protein